jgi:hypothetical protein
MSVADMLAAIPEPEGITLYRYVPFLESGLTTEVACVSGTAGLYDEPEWRPGVLQVPLDLAHDLSWQGPRAYVSLDRACFADGRNAVRWRISALSLTEQEAEQAFHAVAAVVS